MYEQKGFAKEQLKSGLASVRRMKILKRKINDLTWHWEYRFESIPNLCGSWIWPAKCSKNGDFKTRNNVE